MPEQKIPAAEKARRYRVKLGHLVEKIFAYSGNQNKANFMAMLEEASTVRTQLDVEEEFEGKK